MLLLLIDMGIIWFLLNVFSDESWDDQKFKIFGIVLAISLLGGFSAKASIPYVGPFGGLGVYFVVGTLCLWGLASLELKKALAAMGILIVVKLIIVGIGIAMMS
ncbi:MAG: hypothetical protein JNM43_11960 [Planctomycetaceae bacterium]|nr:hypothetical protein [Planctomycetaceae bacterium]